MFVSHLCLCKSVMGVYLAVMGVTDQLFSGVYLWRDRTWRFSSWCTMSGFLFLLSSQVSVFLILCMTLDHCVTFLWGGRGIDRTRKVSLLMCAVSWIGGAVLAIVPATLQWNDFSQTSLCIPLPVPQDQVAGHRYAFGLLVVLNTMLMLITAAGQTYIYIIIRNNTLAFFVDNQKTRDLTVARRCVSLAVTDACCWFLVALWALVTSQGVSVPEDVKSMAVFAIFASSALTPYLYLLNLASERRKQIQKQRLLKRLGQRMAGKK